MFFWGLLIIVKSFWGLMIVLVFDDYKRVILVNFLINNGNLKLLVILFIVFFFWNFSVKILYVWFISLIVFVFILGL